MSILLETKRLIICSPEIKDIEQVCKLDSDPDVMRYIGKGVPRSHQETDSLYIKSMEHFQKHHFSFGVVFEKKTGQFVGRAGINYKALDDTQPDIEIGYRLAKKYWNKGYATELASALVQWGFQELKLDKLCGFTHPDNQGSRRVLEKVGMTLVGNDKYNDIDVVRYEIKHTTK